MYHQATLVGYAAPALEEREIPARKGDRTIS